MAYLNYFLQFKAFSDKNPSNSPNLNVINWIRDVQGVVANNPASQVFTIPASGSITVFDTGEGIPKKFAYVEADAAIQIAINGQNIVISPVVIGSSSVPGSFLMNGTVNSLILTNPSSTDAVDVFVAHAE